MMTPDAAPTTDSLQQQAIAAWFESNLQRGEREIDCPRRFWPMSPGSKEGFYCVRAENINKILNDYRTAGWTVSGDGPWLFGKAV